MFSFEVCSLLSAASCVPLIRWLASELISFLHTSFIILNNAVKVSTKKRSTTASFILGTQTKEDDSCIDFDGGKSNNKKKKLV